MASLEAAQPLKHGSNEKTVTVLQFNVSHECMNPKLEIGNDEVALQLFLRQQGIENPFDNILRLISKDLTKKKDVYYFQEVDPNNPENWERLLGIFDLDSKLLLEVGIVNSEKWCAILSNPMGKFKARVMTVYNIEKLGSVSNNFDFNLGWEPDGRPCQVIFTENYHILINVHFPQPIAVLKNLNGGIKCTNEEFMILLSSHFNKCYANAINFRSTSSVTLQSITGNADLVSCAHGFSSQNFEEGSSWDEKVKAVRYMGAKNARGSDYIFSNTTRCDHRVIHMEDILECGSDHLPVEACVDISEPTVIVGGDFNIGNKPSEGGNASVYFDDTAEHVLNLKILTP